MNLQWEPIDSFIVRACVAFLMFVLLVASCTITLDPHTRASVLGPDLQVTVSIDEGQAEITLDATLSFSPDPLFGRRLTVRDRSGAHATVPLEDALSRYTNVTLYRITDGRLAAATPLGGLYLISQMPPRIEEASREARALYYRGKKSYSGDWCLGKEPERIDSRDAGDDFRSIYFNDFTFLGTFHFGSYENGRRVDSRPRFYPREKAKEGFADHGLC